MRTWLAMLAVTATSATLKASGPLVMGERRLPAVAARIIDYLAPALLGALVTVALLGPGWSDSDGTQVLGVATAAGLRFARVPIPICVVVGMAATAAFRALS